jgi:hypothetical protein
LLRAYAGSVFAGAQFPDLPEPYQLAHKYFRPNVTGSHRNQLQKIPQPREFNDLFSGQDAAN